MKDKRIFLILIGIIMSLAISGCTMTEQPSGNYTSNLTEQQKVKVIEIALGDAKVREEIGDKGYEIGDVFISEFQYAYGEERGTWRGPRVEIYAGKRDQPGVTLSVFVDMSEKKVVIIGHSYRREPPPTMIATKPADIDIFQGQYPHFISKGNQTKIDLTIIGRSNISEGMELFLTYEMEVWYLNGSYSKFTNESAPQGISLKFEPAKVIFPDKLSSNLTLAIDQSALDGDYRVIIGGTSNKTLDIARQVIDFTIGKESRLWPTPPLITPTPNAGGN